MPDALHGSGAALQTYGQHTYAGAAAGLNDCVASVSMSGTHLSVQQHWRCSENIWRRGPGANQANAAASLSM